VSLRGVSVNRDAPVVASSALLIRAPIQVVWDIQTDIADWPSWQPDVERAAADTPLAVGAVFSRQRGGMAISSTVEAFEPPHRIVWGGAAGGIVAVHAWTLEEQGDGVLVRTEESWEGEPVSASPEAMQSALDASLRAWLENLRRAAENRAR
jgi:uncharacterized protein YndB with AHSA1/START domain